MNTKKPIVLLLLLAMTMIDDEDIITIFVLYLKMCSFLSSNHIIITRLWFDNTPFRKIITELKLLSLQSVLNHTAYLLGYA